MTTRETAYHRSSIDGILRYSVIPGHPSGFGWAPCGPKELRDARRRGISLMPREEARIENSPEAAATTATASPEMETFR